MFAASRRFSALSQYPTSGNANSQPELNQCGIARCPSSGISANSSTGGIVSQSRKRSPPSARARNPRASADNSGAPTQGEISATWVPRPSATAGPSLAVEGEAWDRAVRLEGERNPVVLHVPDERRREDEEREAGAEPGPEIPEPVTMARRAEEKSEQADGCENRRIFGEPGAAQRETGDRPEGGRAPPPAGRSEQDFGDRPACDGEEQQQRHIGHDEPVRQHQEVGRRVEREERPQRRLDAEQSPRQPEQRPVDRDDHQPERRARPSALAEQRDEAVQNPLMQRRVVEVG